MHGSQPSRSISNIVQTSLRSRQDSVNSPLGALRPVRPRWPRESFEASSQLVARSTGSHGAPPGRPALLLASSARGGGGACKGHKQGPTRPAGRP